jgi:hypothetical protein
MAVTVKDEDIVVGHLYQLRLEGGGSGEIVSATVTDKHETARMVTYSMPGKPLANEISHEHRVPFDAFLSTVIRDLTKQRIEQQHRSRLIIPQTGPDQG